VVIVLGLKLLFRNNLNARTVSKNTPLKEGHREAQLLRVKKSVKSNEYNY